MDIEQEIEMGMDTIDHEIIIWGETLTALGCDSNNSLKILF